MTMKVGVQGRVLLGPAGGPGQVDIPLRMAVVQEGPAPKTIVSKFYGCAVAVPPGQTERALRACRAGPDIPDAARRRFDAYVVYVGFDPASADSQARAQAHQGQTEAPVAQVAHVTGPGLNSASEIEPPSRPGLGSNPPARRSDVLQSVHEERGRAFDSAPL